MGNNNTFTTNNRIILIYRKKENIIKHSFYVKSIVIDGDHYDFSEKKGVDVYLTFIRKDGRLCFDKVHASTHFCSTSAFPKEDMAQEYKKLLEYAVATDDYVVDFDDRMYEMDTQGIFPAKSLYAVSGGLIIVGVIAITKFIQNLYTV